MPRIDVPGGAMPAPQTKGVRGQPVDPSEIMAPQVRATGPARPCHARSGARALQWALSAARWPHDQAQLRAVARDIL